MKPPAPIRITKPASITVCTRPFRAAGPRLEAEYLGRRLLIHNYGHGGSGWSLSWGSAAAALALARRHLAADLAGRQVAVLGAGALGLTLATTLQEAGAQVTLYTRDQPAKTRSSRATGSWTPDSRIALTRALAPTFAAHWLQMAQHSWRTYHTLLALPGHPVEFTARYTLTDLPPDQAYAACLAQDPIGFARLADQCDDFPIHPEDLAPHPFPTRYARRTIELTFNIHSLIDHLTTSFLAEGGHLVTRTFHTPADLLTVPESVLFNCTGYGARALFADDSLIPIRGQIAWLPPQPECLYGLFRNNLIVLSRRDGTVVQLNPQGDASGWNDPSEIPNADEAQDALNQLQSIQPQAAPPQRPFPE